MPSELEGRPFSFYPAIIGIDHNEWTLVAETWAELLIRNTRTPDLEIGIPRRAIGEISSIDEPVRIVGLRQELEYRAGQVWPARRTVVDMPAPPPTRPAKWEPVHPSSRPEGAEGKVGRLIGTIMAAVALGAIATLAVIKLTPEAKPVYSPKDQSYITLTRDDDAFSIIRKIGQPTEDVWRPGSEELHYRRLTYKDRGYSLILMGTSRETAHYIGAMNADWKPIHSIDIGKNASTASLLRSLPRF